MFARGIRIVLWAGYWGLLMVLFVATGYVSFNLFVRSGVTAVPDVVGLTEAAAEAELSDQGLKAKRKPGDERYDDKVPAGKILQQAPEGGGLVKRGSFVDLRLSLGPQLIEVPELMGTTLQEAQVTLSSAGLNLGRTRGVFGYRGARGTVVAQVPEEGDRVGRGQEVDLYLCREGRLNTFVMPDLIYRDYKNVERFFERQGFRLGSVKFEPYEGIVPGVVLRQFPLAGHPLRQRDVISLVVVSSDHLIDENGSGI